MWMFANSGDWLTSIAYSFSSTGLTEDPRWVLLSAVLLARAGANWKIGDYIETLHFQWDNAVCIAMDIHGLSLKYSF